MSSAYDIDAINRMLGLDSDGDGRGGTGRINVRAVSDCVPLALPVLL